MDNMPIIRLTVEGMKISMLKAFDQHVIEIDTYVQQELERLCAPDNLRRVIATKANLVIEEVIRDALGSDAIKKIIIERLLSVIAPN